MRFENTRQLLDVALDRAERSDAIEAGDAAIAARTLLTVLELDGAFADELEAALAADNDVAGTPGAWRRSEDDAAGANRDAIVSAGAAGTE